MNTSLSNKYPIKDWVLSQNNVEIGDTIAFFCEKTKREVYAEVLGFPDPECVRYLSCKRSDCGATEIINFYSTIVYVIKRASEQKIIKKCSCGALHTSNPGFHLNYCDLS